MSALPPCRICGCIDGEPGLCHAVTPGGVSCHRVKPHDDWCSACATWSKDLRRSFPDNAPIEAFAAHHRSERADAAAAKRGTSVPGAYALRVHAARLRRLALRLLAEGGFIDPAYKKQTPEPVSEEAL